MKHRPDVEKDFYQPSLIWLHGGPMVLEGGALRRQRDDMGALFFCKDSPVGRWYTATYAEDGRIWLATLNAPEDTILDITKVEHLEILKQRLTCKEFRYVLKSRGKTGHLDWSFAKMLQPVGFRGAIFEERPKGLITDLPENYHMAKLPESVVSVGMFFAEDVKIFGSMSPDNVWERMILNK